MDILIILGFFFIATFAVFGIVDYIFKIKEKNKSKF